MNKHVEALRAALEQQRKYERENWPFVGEKNQPTGTGESITYHLASLYQWSPEYVLTLPEQQRNERLKEVWRSFVIAGDIIKRYEDATTALLQAESEPVSQDQGEQVRPAHPAYEVIGQWQARQWRKWTYDASDDELLEALRGCGDSWESVPAQECSDELQQRGYILVGAYPHEVELERKQENQAAHE